MSSPQSQEFDLDDHTNYKILNELLAGRMSVRKLKTDPLPEGTIDRVLENARWAMSGANSQPWEYIVVTDPDMKQKLYDTYYEINNEFIFWMEQQRAMEYRHPAYILDGDPEEALDEVRKKQGWNTAPALIVVIGDGRKQWGTVQGAHTLGLHQTHLTDGLTNTSFLIHLSAAALGLGTQWVTIHIEEPFKRVLGVPDLYTLFTIIPIGLPAVEPRPGVRRPLEDLVHHDRFEQDKFLTNKEILEYIRNLRNKTVGKYASSFGDAESNRVTTGS